MLIIMLLITSACGKETQPSSNPTKGIILATTTSTEDSGLLDVVLPPFEQETGIQVKVIAVGTGQAIKLGEDGNADVILVHSRKAEDQFVADGFGMDAYDVMYNQFLIVGPESDPAGIKGMQSAADALKK
ncbi:substrate-binding domain-containing protein [Ammoniphilus sp. YIM 78166]|uniref:substrate-binding domain-containing protein n=1 Tax=Ammoniphilus sp. YIM 78166 TaxID=1644106 RepID=UPI0021024651|nr:substrate-binding domain-containing protein [Ammoniphilus sp. YIM 78166]